MTVRLFKHPLWTVVEPLRLLHIVSLLGVALGSFQIGKTGEVLQADVGGVGVTVHGGRVARHQVDGAGDVILAAQPDRHVYHASLVDQGQVEGQGDVERDQEDDPGGGGGTVVPSGQLLGGSVVEEGEDGLDEPHLLVFQPGQDGQVEEDGPLD